MKKLNLQQGDFYFSAFLKVEKSAVLLNLCLRVYSTYFLTNVLDNKHSSLIVIYT